MADTKISALPAGTTLVGAEAIPIVQGGATVKTTATAIKNFTSASPALITPTATSLTAPAGNQNLPINPTGTGSLTTTVSAIPALTGLCQVDLTTAVPNDVAKTASYSYFHQSRTSASPGSAHGVGAILRADDVASGTVPIFGGEMRVDGVGAASTYGGGQIIANHIGTGYSGNLVGLFFPTIAMYNDDGTTPSTTGVNYGINMAPLIGGALKISISVQDPIVTAASYYAGSGVQQLTDAAGKILSSALNTVAITQGGTGLATLGTPFQLLRVNTGGTALEFAGGNLRFGDGTITNGGSLRIGSLTTGTNGVNQIAYQVDGATAISGNITGLGGKPWSWIVGGSRFTAASGTYVGQTEFDSTMSFGYNVQPNGAANTDVQWGFGFESRYLNGTSEISSEYYLFWSSQLSGSNYVSRRPVQYNINNIDSGNVSKFAGQVEVNYNVDLFTINSVSASTPTSGGGTLTNSGVLFWDGVNARLNIQDGSGNPAALKVGEIGLRTGDIIPNFVGNTSSGLNFRNTATTFAANHGTQFVTSSLDFLINNQEIGDIILIPNYASNSSNPTLRLAKGGRVLIGLLAAAADSGDTLQVRGNQTLTSSGDTTLHIVGGSFPGINIKSSTFTSGIDIITDGSTDFKIRCNDNKPVSIGSNGNTRLTVTDLLVSAIGVPFQRLNTSGTSVVDAFQAYNPTAATNGGQQYSPAFHWKANAWKTGGTPGSQSIEFISYIQGVQGSTSADGNWILAWNRNGGTSNVALNYNVSTDLLTVNNLSVATQINTDLIAAITSAGANNITIDDGAGNMLITSTSIATFSNSIQTGNPVSGTAAAWKLGSAASGVALALNTSSYIQIEIAGVAHKLAKVL